MAAHANGYGIAGYVADNEIICEDCMVAEYKWVVDENSHPYGSFDNRKCVLAIIDDSEVNHPSWLPSYLESTRTFFNDEYKWETVKNFPRSYVEAFIYAVCYYRGKLPRPVDRSGEVIGVIVADNNEGYESDHCPLCYKDIYTYILCCKDNPSAQETYGLEACLCESCRKERGEEIE